VRGLDYAVCGFGRANQGDRATERQTLIWGIDCFDA